MTKSDPDQSAPAQGGNVAAAVDQAPATPLAPADPAPSPSPVSMPQHKQPNTEDEPGESADPDDAPSAAERKARREAKNLRDRLLAETKEREKLAQQVAELAEQASKAVELEQTLAKLAAVFNPGANVEEEPPDPVKLAEQVEAERQAREALAAEKDAQIRALTVKAALPAAFTKANADPELTTAVLVSSGALDKLDPSAESFAADLESAVKAAVEANPKLKVAPVAVRSGSEITGKPGGSDQVTREQLARMTPEQIEEARRKGRLRNLLSGAA